MNRVMQSDKLKMLTRLLKKVMAFRHFDYVLFVLLIWFKLKVFHSHIHARYIDMNLLDDIIAAGSIMLLSFWVLWLPHRGRRFALTVLNFMLTLLIIADLVYYRYSGDFITVPILLQEKILVEPGTSHPPLISFSDLIFLADWIICALIVLTISRKSPSREVAAASLSGPTNRHGTMKKVIQRILSGLLVFILGYAMTMGPIHFYKKTMAVGLFEGNWWNISMYNVTGLLGFHYYDAMRYSKEHLVSREDVPAAEQEEMKQWFREHQNRFVSNDTFGAYAGSNVTVIQVEGFMNFMIGKRIGNQEITPNFNALMKESLYFSNFYHQTANGRTSDADFTSHSSLYPLAQGSVFVRFPHQTYHVLPQILRDHGYTTRAFHAYDGSFWNRSMMYKSMGYDHYYSKRNFKMDEYIGWSLGDKSFFRQSMDIIRKNQEAAKPSYSFLITLSSHHPFSLPAKVKEKQNFDTGDFKGTMFGSYLEAIHYTDAALGELVERMKQEGLWDSTILYIYGDHDNSIKEKEPYEQFLGRSLTDLDMHQIRHQVPMLIHLPDSKHAGTYDEPAGQLDMAPSLMHLLGISGKPYYMMGNNLFSGHDRFVVLRSGAFTDGKLYYIPSEDRLFQNGSCYDLSSRNLTDLEKCRQPYSEANKRLHISDTLITRSLIGQFEEENRKPSNVDVDDSH